MFDGFDLMFDGLSMLRASLSKPLPIPGRGGYEYYIVTFAVGRAGSRCDADFKASEHPYEHDVIMIGAIIGQ